MPHIPHYTHQTLHTCQKLFWCSFLFLTGHQLYLCLCQRQTCNTSLECRHSVTCSHEMRKLRGLRWNPVAQNQLAAHRPSRPSVLSGGFLGRDRVTACVSILVPSFPTWNGETLGCRTGEGLEQSRFVTRSPWVRLSLSRLFCVETESKTCFFWANKQFFSACSKPPPQLWHFWSIVIRRHLSDKLSDTGAKNGALCFRQHWQYSKYWCVYCQIWSYS